MSEQVILVCDTCGQPAQDTAGIRVGAKSYLKDLCAKHLGELLTGTRAPRRGRRRAVVASAATNSSKRTTRRSKSAAVTRRKRTTTRTKAK